MDVNGIYLFFNLKFDNVMTSEQESRLSMYLTVRDFLNGNATVTATLPNYSSVYNSVADGCSSNSNFSCSAGVG